jgi:hypothetical protein
MPLRLHHSLPALALAAALAAGLSVGPLSAQQQASLAPAVPPSAPQPAGVMDSLSSLASEPAAHTSFTFDRSQLQIAEQLLGSVRGGDQGPVAALDSITVDSYRYTKPAFYDPEGMASIRAGYRGGGWKHLVNANTRPGDSATAQTMTTDLWLHFRGAEIDNVTVLVRGAREMNLIQVTGALRPLDLIHLSGHFGIPKVDPGALMVPAPDGK